MSHNNRYMRPIGPGIKLTTPAMSTSDPTKVESPKDTKPSLVTRASDKMKSALDERRENREGKRQASADLDARARSISSAWKTELEKFDNKNKSQGNAAPTTTATEADLEAMRKASSIPLPAELEPSDSSLSEDEGMTPILEVPKKAKEEASENEKPKKKERKADMPYRHTGVYAVQPDDSLELLKLKPTEPEEWV